MRWPFTREKEKEPAKPVAHSRRGYSAAQISRLTASWATGSQSIDWDLYKSLNILRARSRDLCTNNEYGHKFLQMCGTNVVGPQGFRLQVRVKETAPGGEVKSDKAASKAIESAFWDWAKRGNCDVTGKHSFFDICNLYIKAVARDGEVLIKKVYGKQAGRHGFQLQILDIDRLDVNKNDRRLANGNIIKMGVEVTPYGKPVNYHLRIAHPGDNPYYSFEGQLYEVVPAADIYHHFVSDRPEQTRGAPWLSASMMRLQNLGGFEEAAVIAARVGAAKMGFFTTPDGDGTAVSDDTENDDGTGDLITDAEPGTFGVLPEGYSFESFNPDYPSALYKDFVKTGLRGVASGLGVSYNTLGNDLEGVNFSSIRSGVIEERDNWIALQNWMIESLLDDLFSTWLKFSLISGAVTIGPQDKPLPAAKFDKYNSAVWQGRRWQWVDPEKDANANILLINNGLRSRTDVVAEQGGDFEEVVTQLSEEQKMLETAGIKVAPPPAGGDQSKAPAKPPADPKA